MSDYFAATKPDGTPRVYIGMHRPAMCAEVRERLIPFAQFAGGYREVDILAAYQAGRVDVPMYRDPEADA